jgi:hypothetical protein
MADETEGGLSTVEVRHGPDYGAELKGFFGEARTLPTEFT